MIATIHQPEHLPWLGFFDKLAQADVFIALDNVPFRKNYFQNRNRIRTSQGNAWLTVPVSCGHDMLINNVPLAVDRRWRKKWWDSICFAYAKAPYFQSYANQLASVILEESELLCEINLALINALLEFLEIDVPLFRASNLGVKGRQSELLLACCQEVGASTYISGISGLEYLDHDLFDSAGIKVLYQEFHHPIYRQCFDPFIPCMSVVDLLFNHGAQSRKILLGRNTPRLINIFF